jgi:NAD(P)H-nitrite reductase large subunit
VISREKQFTYSRPLIAYYLSGKRTLAQLAYRGEDFYVRNHCETRLGREAVAIDAGAQQVKLMDGETIPYDRLLVATGSKSFIPPMKGMDLVEKKFTFLSQDDAVALNDALTFDNRVLILGAGLIGLKCAEGIAHRVAALTVIDLAPQILNSILDGEAAARVQMHIEREGVKFLLGDSVAYFDSNMAHLLKGGEVQFDILVVAVGVRPNTDLLEAAGAQVNRGALVDDSGATSLNNVFAAGDCAQSYDVNRGERRVLALLPNAYMQGESAGIAMAGGCKPYHKGIAMNAIGFFGLHMITAGSYEGESRLMTDGKTYKRLFVKDDRLRGYIMVGDVTGAGIYTSLLRERTPLSTLDFELICEKPQLMAFSRAVRDKELGGRG